MPNKFNFVAPPMARGSVDERMNQMQSWFYRFIEQLNVAFDGGDDEAKAAATGVTQTQLDNFASQREGLNQLIVRTAAQLRNEMKAAAPRHGTVQAVSLASGAYQDVQVSFDETLPSVPTVTVGLISPGTDTHMSGGVTASVLSGTVTTEGFTLRIANNSGQNSAYSYGAAWIAAV